MKFADYDIVFQEIPDEVTLAINISNCPNHCVGCHSAYLMKDVGYELTEESLQVLLDKYAGDITCVCFMGGDREPNWVAYLAHYIKSNYQGKLKVGWYSGKNELPDPFPLNNFDFVKIGRYEEAFGPLKSESTNQRLYRVVEGELQDITSMFWKKK